METTTSMLLLVHSNIHSGFAAIIRVESTIALSIMPGMASWDPTTWIDWIYCSGNVTMEGDIWNLGILRSESFQGHGNLCFPFPLYFSPLTSNYFLDCFIEVSGVCIAFGVFLLFQLLAKIKRHSMSINSRTNNGDLQLTGLIQIEVCEVW